MRKRVPQRRPLWGAGWRREGAPPSAEPDTTARQPTLYERAWDAYAAQWPGEHPSLEHIGDEWIGVEAGASTSLEEYCALIERTWIAPYVRSHHDVLEIGVGGGRTAALLLAHCRSLTCVDTSQEMLDATRARLGEERVRYVKNDGIHLDELASGSADLCFCFDTMVHLEPRDIFNYLCQLPRVLRGDRLCVFHHADTLSALGWRKFLGEWRNSLGGRRHGTSFSVMTVALMARFLDHLGYEVIARDPDSVPRDCVWVCRAPEPR